MGMWMNMSATRYMLALGGVLVLLPLIQLIAGGVLVAAARHMEAGNAGRVLVFSCRILGVIFFLYTLVTAVHRIYSIIPILWP